MGTRMITGRSFRLQQVQIYSIQLRLSTQTWDPLKACFILKQLPVHVQHIKMYTFKSDFCSFKLLTDYSAKREEIQKGDWILLEVCILLLLKEDRTSLEKEREREQTFVKTWRGVMRHPVTAWATRTQSTKHVLFSPSFVETDTQNPLSFILLAPI